MKSAILLTLLMCLFCLAVTTAQAQPQTQSLTLGVLAHRGEAQAVNRWQPTVDYLNRRVSGMDITLRPLNAVDLVQAVADQELDFVLTNPGQYIVLESRYGVTRLVTLQNLRQGQSQNRFGAVIIARSDRDDIQNLEDLKDKRFGAVKATAFGGYRMAARAMLEAGINPKHDLAELRFMGFPQDAIVQAVVNGELDAGTVRTDVIEQMASEGLLNLSKIKVLQPKQAGDFPFLLSTRLYPEWPLAKLATTDTDIARRLTIALLSMTIETPAAMRGSYAGWSVPIDYTPVHDLHRLLKVEPYEPTNAMSVGDVFRLHGWWISPLILSLFMLGAYNFLVQQQANRRAVELKRQTDAAHRTEEELQQLRQRAMVTLASIADGVISVDVQQHITYMNPVAEELTGWTNDDVKGMTLDQVFNLVDENNRENQQPYIQECMEKSQARSIPGSPVLLNRYEAEIPVEASIAPLRDENMLNIGTVLVFRNVTHSRHMANRIAWQASHDALTGLINRFEFDQRLEDAYNSAQSNDEEHALLYLDLDQFKVINDTCGHIAGDELLRRLAPELRKHIRSNDVLARLGGDEFGVLLINCPREKAINIANGLRETVQDFRFPWKEHTFSIGISIGLSFIDNTCNGADRVLSQADAACYAAKDRGRNRVHIHEEDDEDLTRRHGEMQWVSRISAALEENRFVLYFQAIEPVERSKHGIRGELLVRMLNPDGELAPPGAFLPAAERYNLISGLDRWVVNHALDWLRNRRELLPRIESLSINLSGATMADDEFLHNLSHQLERETELATRICFEITETAAIANIANAENFIRRTRDLGCRFALDDFGTGLSSFSYLKNLHVDYLKIDGSFVRDIDKDEIDRAMVRSIHEIGRVLKLQTIAEFVENDHILLHLRDIGVDYGQGYGIARPVPLNSILETQDADSSAC